MNDRHTKIGKTEVVMTKIKLADANKIMVPIMSAIMKFSIHSVNIFDGLTPTDIDSIQQLCCKTIVVKETGSNLTLMDLEKNIENLVVLYCEFLEYNFSFFSQAQKVTEVIGSLIFGREEKN